MKTATLISHSPQDTQDIGRKLGGLAQPGDVLLLEGNLGAGKTCLTQGIAWGLGIKEYTLSPSFVIMRELHGRLPLYHIDLYRLDNLHEIADLGLDDYLYGQGISVVEWAGKAPGLLPAQRLLVRIEAPSETKRILYLEPRGERYHEMVAHLAPHPNKRHG